MKKDIVKKTICSVCLVFSFLALISGQLIASAVAENPDGIGDIKYTWSREVYSGVEINFSASENTKGAQKTFLASCNPLISDIKPMLTFGDTIIGGETMDEVIAKMEAKGKRVIFGTNADVYDLATGASNGLMIQGGRMVSSYNGYDAIGFRKDGSVIFGSGELKMTVDVSGKNLVISKVNKERKKDWVGIYLLTSDFAKTTLSTAEGLEVIVNIASSGENSGLKIGQPLIGEVKEVRKVENNKDKNDTPIEDGTVVLSCHRNSIGFSVFSKLKAGDAIKINIDDLTKELDWSNVVEGVGIFTTLVKNGKVIDEVIANKDIHPRTIFGIDSAGKMLCLVNDGRQPDWSVGTNFGQIVEYMRGVLGCEQVFNWDGGGSSVFAAYFPGIGTKVLNRPSDGKQRRNCNYMLFTTDIKKADDIPSKIFIYPDKKGEYAPKATMLVGSKLKLKTIITDANYFPIKTSKQVEYSIVNLIGDVGEISKDGLLKAGKAKATGKIIAKYDNLVEEFAVDIVDDIKTIVAKDNKIVMPINTKVSPQIMGYDNYTPIFVDDAKAEYNLMPSEFGTVDSFGCVEANGSVKNATLGITMLGMTAQIELEASNAPIIKTAPKNDVVVSPYNNIEFDIVDISKSGINKTKTIMLFNDEKIENIIQQDRDDNIINIVLDVNNLPRGDAKWKIEVTDNDGNRSEFEGHFCIGSKIIINIIGSGTIVCDAFIGEKEVKTAIIKAESGNKLESLTLNGVSAECNKDGNYILKNISQDCVITANFITANFIKDKKGCASASMRNCAILLASLSLYFCILLKIKH